MGEGDEVWYLRTEPATGYYVCDRCFGDDTIKGFIKANTSHTECDFCGRQGDEQPIAAPLVDVADLINDSIAREYQRAVEILPWDSGEGGYQGRHFDSYDLLRDEIGLELPNDDGQLLQVLAECVGDEVWCERNPFSLREDEKLVYSWERFSNLIKHERRYFFLYERRDRENDYDREYLGPSKLLQFIGETVRDFDLIKTIKQGSLTYRARHLKSGENLQSPHDLGPPPKEKATWSNRMSPAGIVMFYASDDPATAIAEIDDDPNVGIVVGTFRVTKAIQVLDLTRLPARPSFFDRDIGYDRYAVHFLHAFVESLAAKVEPGEREHIDYVPTQVVTEWFRTVFRYRDSPIDGIYYPSSQKRDGRSLVLFANRDHLLLTPEQIRQLAEQEQIEEWWVRTLQEKAWLELVGVRVERSPKPI